MADPTNKTELLSAIRTARAAWTTLLAQVDAARMTEPGLEGDWSLKDVLAHIAFYEERTLARLRAAADGTPFTPLAATAGMDMEARNAWVYAQNRTRPLAVIRAEEERLYNDLLTTVAALSDADLFTPGRYAWMGDDPLWEVIPGNVPAHYQEHIPPLRAWLGANAA